MGKRRLRGNMRKQIITTVLALSLSACGGLGEGTLQNLNPTNLFGGTETEEQTDTQTTITRKESADGKADVAEVANVRLDYTPSGAILHAQGITTMNGYHSGSLRALNFGEADAAGIVTYAFRAIPPSDISANRSTSMTLSAGTFIPNSQLRRINAVTVTGAQNAITVRIR